MALHDADLEQDMFYVAFGHDDDETPCVYKRGVVEHDDGGELGDSSMGFLVCAVPPDAPDGTAEQIARALNRLPKAEAILVDVVGAIREADANLDGGKNYLGDLPKVADAIEEWMCS